MPVGVGWLGKGPGSDWQPRQQETKNTPTEAGVPALKGYSNMKMNIEIDMATLGFDQDEDGDLFPTADLVGRVAQVIADRISGYDIRSTIESEIRNVASEKARAVITEVLAGPIQRTDGYGSPRGETTTVREMVMAEVDKWMKLPKSDGYNRNDTMGDALKKIVDEILRNELKGTIAAAKKKVSEEVLRLAVEGAAAALASARVL